MLTQSAFALIFVILSTIPGFAQEQSFGPVTFQTPLGWACNKQGESLACLEQVNQDPRRIAIVINFKPKSGEDNLDIYKDQLKRPRMLQTGELNTPSELKFVRDISLNSKVWVEGAHFGSELGGYYTHYLATTTPSYAVLFTISVHQSVYPVELAKIKSTLDSIKINDEFKDLKSSSAEGPLSTQSPAASKITEIVKLSKQLPPNILYLAIALLIAAVLLAYAVLK